MKQKKLVHVGTFGQPQGLKGDIKVNILTSSFESFRMLKNYFVEGIESSLNFTSFYKIGKKHIVSINNCIDRDSALDFKGKKIFVYRKNFPKIKSTEYYVYDLIECEVFNTEKKLIGIVIDIKNFGASDLIEIQNKDLKTFFIPMNEENIKTIDINKKQILAHPIKGIL